MRSIYAMLLAAALVCNTNVVTAQSLYENNYESGTGHMSCLFANNCRFRFPANSTAKPVLVTHIGCYIHSTGPLKGVSLGSAASAGSTPAKAFPLPVPQPAVSSDEHYTNINTQVRVLVGPGKLPTVSIAALKTVDVIEGNCQLYGNPVP